MYEEILMYSHFAKEWETSHGIHIFIHSQYNMSGRIKKK